ncbi:hypothetical protein GYMLUDRAFT_239090, partial [Collybiopsis luxurians FD-317 M1]
MATYTLEVHIDSSQLPLLKNPENPYTLCVARKVGDKYNVVWKGNEGFLEHNTFEWTNKYKVFAANTFKSGALVKAASNDVSIEYKQEAIFNQSGVMEHAKDDTEHPVDGTFKVINNHGTIHFGVSAEVDG